MMKFGLLTAILDGWSFEEVVDIASQMGFKCLEVACWPAGKAERRYAGVSHIDCERVCRDDSYADYVKELTSSRDWRFLLWPSIPTPWTRTWKSGKRRFPT